MDARVEPGNPLNSGKKVKSAEERTNTREKRGISLETKEDKENYKAEMDEERRARRRAAQGWNERKKRKKEKKNPSADIRPFGEDEGEKEEKEEERGEKDGAEGRGERTAGKRRMPARATALTIP